MLDAHSAETFHRHHHHGYLQAVRIHRVPAVLTRSPLVFVRGHLDVWSVDGARDLLAPLPMSSASDVTGLLPLESGEESRDSSGSDWIAEFEVFALISSFLLWSSTSRSEIRSIAFSIALFIPRQRKLLLFVLVVGTAPSITNWLSPIIDNLFSKK